MFDNDYLLQLIANQVEENPELEYKAAGALKRDDKKVMEITKDVSSFANSNGGVLIYGIGEDQRDKRFPGQIDPLDCKVISKEWLEQIINSRIRPRIHGLKIHVVTLPESQNKVVYVLEIPKGNTAHQADDKRYYRRHNFTVESLFDHEIRDIMNRQKAPEIKVIFIMTTTANVMTAPNEQQVVNRQNPGFYNLNIYIENVGKIYAKYINLVLTFPHASLYTVSFLDQYKGNTVIQLDNKVRDLVEPRDESRSTISLTDYNKPKQYGTARHEPLLPGMRMMLKSIVISKEAFEPGNVLSWTIYADNAEPKAESIEFLAI